MWIPSSLRFALRPLAGRLLWPLGARLAAAQARGGQGLILMFHHVGAPILPGAEDYLFLSPAGLGRILDFVARELRPLPPLEFLARLAEGSLPPRATLLTFDDGTCDQVVTAAAEFVKRGLQACFFVCPGLIESGASAPSLELATLCQHADMGRAVLTLDGVSAGSTSGPIELDVTDQRSRVQAFWTLLPIVMRTPSRRHPALLASLRTALHVDPAIRCPYRPAVWQELAALAAAGMVVGNHTLYHSTADADGVQQFAADAAAAFDALESRSLWPPVAGRQMPRIFAYPYGRPADANPATTQALEQQGVAYAFVVQGGLARPHRTGLLNLHREAAALDAQAVKLAVMLACLR
ncbi:MAG: hypothetical protein FJ011_17960 [Chloroflexi bacterium]|nr:hypothetical protein [Chloroflexota bacterium]